MAGLLGGCDIVFVIKGSDSEPITIGSNLTYGLATYQAVAELLINKHPDILQRLRELVKGANESVPITKEDIEKGNLISNATVKLLADRFPDLGWDNIDLSARIFSANDFVYYGKDLSNMTLHLRNRNGQVETVYVIDPTNSVLVETLRNNLYIKSLLQLDLSLIIDNSNLSEIISNLDTVKLNFLKKLEELNTLKLVKDKSNDLWENYVSLVFDKPQYEHFSKLKVRNASDLILDYIDNASMYKLLPNINTKQGPIDIEYELDRVCRLILGIKINDNYQDEFVDYIVNHSKRDFSKNASKISRSDFENALRLKISALQLLAESLSMSNLDRVNLERLSQDIALFLSLKTKTLDGYKAITLRLIDSANDDYSYKVSELTKNFIYLKSVPLTLELRSGDYTRNSISLYTKEESYKGFNIYTNTDGDYFIDRHILTDKSYTGVYKSLQECRDKINSRVANNYINLQTLLELKTRGDSEKIYVPNKFIPGQVLRSLKIELNKNQELNEEELSFIYDDGSIVRGPNGRYIKDHTVSAFHNYLIRHTKNGESLRTDIENTLDTAEKVATFIYLLNDPRDPEDPNNKSKYSKYRGPVRQTLPLEEVLKLLNFIKLKEAEGYNYYIVQSVGDPFTTNKFGFKHYRRKEKGKYINKQSYPTVIVPIEDKYIKNDLVEMDSDKNGMLPIIIYLKDFANKIYDKLGVKVNIVTLSLVDDLKNKWGENIPDDAKGFIKDGEIYINSSLAGIDTLTHEFSHIMLGLLKAKNFDNYMRLVSYVANKKKNLKAVMRQKYPNKADSDLNEEVFAVAFSEYMSGREFKSIFKELEESERKVFDDFKTLFGPGVPTEIENLKLTDVLRLFSYDLRYLMNYSENGLEIKPKSLNYNTITSYRQASNWIEELIKEHNDDPSKNIGVIEKC